MHLSVEEATLATRAKMRQSYRQLITELAPGPGDSLGSICARDASDALLGDTNVKPYRCQSCHLSFTRRDLLQRHINTYHVAKNPMERSQHGVHTITGKNQIACLNCAQAKTGCDKQLPRCTRCREKGLNCEPRYARRSTKAVARATAAATAATANLESMVAAMPPTPQDSSMMPVMMDSDPRLEFQAKVSMSPAEGPLTMDPQMPQYDDLYKKSSMAGAQMTLEGQYSLSNMPENYGDLMYSPTMIQNTGFPEVWHWNAYPLFEPNYSALQSTQANASIHSLEDVMDTTSVHVSPPQPLMDAISIGTNSAHVSPVQPLLDVISMTTNPTHVSPAQLDAISMSTNSEHVTPSLDYTHTRSTSITSTTDPEPRIVETAVPSPLNSVVLDFNEVITAEAAWPLARCNPVSYSGSCPLTAFKHLGFLGRKLRDEDSWSGLAEAIEATEDNRAGAAIIVPTQPQIRDRIIAIAQRYLHKALEIHWNNCRDEDQVAILVLPSCGILDYFLQCYVRSLSSFYSLAPGGRIDANEMVKNNESAALLVLLMIAQGASVVPRDEARILATGLTETCRISLFDMIEKNVVMCADATLNRCALLFTLLGAWSGDKWLMDIAMGQRGMYLSMLRHAGVFEPHSPVPPSFNDPSKIKQQWDAWMERESQNRYAPAGLTAAPR
ncbi:hypothetical protein NUW58_g4390 [Xylaria curta]|uniref:Uncharacterized protein n=1 Tax=Xylaria curta TaxID=42375 RepID=A0ACC1P8W4_9PEZI|nr:hypothetical protein NUW58_g4390 [Xylaria curta]